MRDFNPDDEPAWVIYDVLPGVPVPEAGELGPGGPRFPQSPRPVRRAARWDGAVLCPAAAPGSATDSEQPLTPQQISGIRRFIDNHRTSPGPFDIVAGGPERGPDPGRTRELIRQSAQAGATWFSEWIPPGDPATVRASIARGPIAIGAL